MSPAQAPLSPILLALEGALGRAPKRPKSKAAQTADTFCAEGQLPSDALTVSVEGIGLLASPLPPAAALALHAASTPARHGRRDKTMQDKRVRDTGELQADTLTLRWAEGACDALQAEVASALGLQQIQARLHNLLVYGTGQFFKPHQDTEKHPGMVATLVLVWPSPHIGGELVVRHGSEQAHFASQHLNADTIRWFAFYADCRHEVLPVAEGWRVVLSFDLVLPAPNATPRAPVQPALLDALREHFFPATGPALRPWVLLLDHEYTERGLHWPLLKGADRPRVVALRAAAEALGLTVHLALAEVHEQWTAAVGGGGRGRGRGEWDDRGGRYNQSDPEPDELIDRGIVLNHWVDADDRQLRREELPVADTDTASFSDTDESFLVNQEYEGYMGNYGETLDYWYRRAALVTQTPAAEQAGRFVSDFDGALADALALASQGRGDELAARLQAAAEALDAQCRQRGRALCAAYSKLAAALPDADQARGLMEGFEWVELQSADARALARLSAHPRRGLDRGFDRRLDTTGRSLAQTPLAPGQFARGGQWRDASSLASAAVTTPQGWPCRRAEQSVDRSDAAAMPAGAGGRRHLAGAADTGQPIGQPRDAAASAVRPVHGLAPVCQRRRLGGPLGAPRTRPSACLPAQALATAGAGPACRWPSHRAGLAGSGACSAASGARHTRTQC